MDEWVWSNGGMILTGENWSTGRKTLYSVGGRWMNQYGAMVEWYWQGKTEVLVEKHYTAWVVDGWMSMEQWWNDTDRGKTEVLGQKPVPVPLSRPQISNGLTWNQARDSAVRRRRVTARAMTLPIESLTWIMYKYPVRTAQQTLFVSLIKTSQLMLYREIIAVCSQIHTKHINTLCGPNIESLNIKLAVHIVTTVRYI